MFLFSGAEQMPRHIVVVGVLRCCWRYAHQRLWLAEQPLLDPLQELFTLVVRPKATVRLWRSGGLIGSYRCRAAAAATTPQGRWVGS
jgi:hypothetical protein